MRRVSRAWRNVRWPVSPVELLLLVSALFVVAAAALVVATLPGPEGWPPWGGREVAERAQIVALIVGVLGLAGIVLTLGAGVLELRVALPRQELELEAFVEPDPNPPQTQPDRMLWGLRLRCVGAIVNAYSVEWELLPAFMRTPQRADVHRAERLFPDQDRDVIAWRVSGRADVPQDAFFRARWWTDRNRGDWRNYRVPTSE